MILSYMDEISGTTEIMTMTVPANSTSQGFSIRVGGDDIAAQATRTFNVTVERGLGYDVGDPSAVKINVLNDDPTVVSIISLTTDPIDRR